MAELTKEQLQRLENDLTNLLRVLVDELKSVQVQLLQEHAIDNQGRELARKNIDFC